MTSCRLNMVLALALAVVWTATFALRQDVTRRNRVFMPDMAYSLTHEAQRESPHFPDGVERLPPQGSVARGLPPLPYGATVADAERAGRRLHNPLAESSSTLKRGAAVFATYCVVCHGASGLGDGPVAKSGFPAPPSLLGDASRRLSDGRIFHIITYGQKIMPGYAAQISREDRWKAVLHVRRLQRK